MKRLLLLAILLGLIPLFFLECNPCKCQDPGPPRHFVIDSMQTSVFYDNVYANSYDTSAFYAYDSLAIVLGVYQFKQISYQMPTMVSFSLYGSAMACDCADMPEFIVDNPIAAIQIISQTDAVFNDQITLSTGDTLNTYFTAEIDSDGSRYPLNVFFNSYQITYHQPRVRLYLSAQPKQAMVLAATVLVTLKDGKTFLFEKQELKIR